MCGIAGILRRDARGDEPARVAAMQQALRHRGPDDSGTWQSAAGRATFAHTRLSVLDPTPAGRQPMSCAAGRFTITFNGEIYNFKELRRLLEGRGAAFRTNTDTEIILRAYEAFGESCVDHLRGMFAFALWDEREQTCLLARDRFGIKPLYYHAGDGGLVFASEVKALLHAGVVPHELDRQALYEYFRAGSVQDPRTLLRGVHSLDAAHVMTWDGGPLRTRRYWDLRFAGSDTTESPAQVGTALRDSIRHHFVSDVPVGVFLSGGIDSTCLVALATEAGVGELRTFTLSVPGSPEDEGERARRTAEHFGARHDECRVDAAAARQLFDGFLRAMDQPSIDGLNTYAVSRFARERGMKVMLSGIGADELFGGYPSFSGVPRLAAWRRRIGRVPSAATTLLHGSGDPRARRLADLLEQPAGVTTAYATYRGIFTRAEARTLSERYSGSDAVVDDRPAEAHDDPTPQDAVSRLELSRYVRNQLLRDGDVMSMAFGMELRTPFLDPVLVESVCRIPARQRLAAGKRLLIDAVANVPDGIAYRPKRCFQFPFASWLDGEWRETFAAVERTCPVPTVTWYRKWCVLALERWLAGVAEHGHVERLPDAVASR